jgi:hypothetical protein
MHARPPPSGEVAHGELGGTFGHVLQMCGSGRGFKTCTQQKRSLLAPYRYVFNIHPTCIF